MAKTPRANRTDTTAVPTDVMLMNVTAAVFGTIGAIAIAAVVVFWLARQPAFALRSVRVVGDVTRNSVATIRANAMPHLDGNFFTLDLATGRRAFESVPWVRQAVVNRVWPNRLQVRLEEHKPVALWSTDGSAEKLVNSFGEVFEANLGDVEDDALPTLRGPEGTSAAMLALFRRLQPVFATMDAHIDTLALSGRGSWRVELDTGAEIELGRGTDDEVLERTQSFIATLPQVTGHFQRALQSADLRHHDGYAVKLKGITTVDAATAKKK